MFTFLFLFCWSFPDLWALDPKKTITQYSVQVWNMEAGLPGNTVYTTLQTQEGYLWLGTQDGLVRFDGVAFELFSRENTPQLKGNEIRALYQDRDHTLWIGTTSGGLTRFKQGEFTTYPITKYSALFNIKAINEDRWGNLWIGSFGRGLTCLSNGKFTTYTTKEGLPDNQVIGIYKDGDGDLWVTTSRRILKMPRPGIFQVHPSQDHLPRDKTKTVCLYKEDARELWIGTGGNGLFLWKNNIVTKYGTEAGIPHLTITYLYRDRNKNFWIGTDGGGLTRMGEDGVLRTLPKGDGLADGSVYSIYEDREGSLWVGTLDGGLHQLRDSKFVTYTTREGLAHDYIYCIYEDHAGDLWIGSKGGLNRLKQGALTTELTLGTGLLNNNVLCLSEHPAGCLWIGTWAGMHRLKHGKLTTLTKQNGLSDNRVKCICEDRQGNTWIGTQNGLNRFNNNDGTFTTYFTKDGLLSNAIEFIFQDSSGNLWIGTGTGLNRLKDGVFTLYDPPAGFTNTFFRCAYQDNEGVLWFGTNSGLIRAKEKETTLYSVQCGLVENYIYSILEDEKGYLWLAGRNGISQVKKNQLEAVARGKIHHVRPDWYNEKDGMKSRWCTYSGHKTRDGRFWFPTSAGVAMIDPNHIKEIILPPAPIIEKFIVDGEAINIHKKTREMKPVQLTPGKKRLEFYYTAASFINPQKIRFKLRLDGYDRDWVDRGNARSTTYTGLSPGHYTFNVIAFHPGGIRDQKGVSFSFYLQPSFYQTFWFYLAAALLVTLSVFAGYRFRVRHLKTRAKELSAQVELHTRDLKERNIELENAQQKIKHSKDLIEAKNRQLEKQSEQLKEMDKVKSRFFANISHEFRTPLTLIMGPLEQILTKPPERQELEKKTKMMLRNSQRLLGLINQLLELSKFDSGKVKLQAFPQNIIPFLKGIVASFEPAANQNELDLTFHTEDEEQNITLYFDPEKLEEVLFNLLSNAVKFTPPGGKITVTITRNLEKKENFPSGSVDIFVSDTGPGIPPEQAAHVFDRFYQAESTHELHQKGSGIGLAIAKELVELHHGKIQVQTREGEGTEFIIHLPLGRGVPADIKEKPRAADLEAPHAMGLEGPRAAGEAGDSLGADKNIVLVVEDNADVREYIRGALEPLYTVMEAKDGTEGIQKAQEIIPDLIISDIMMPGADGYELCRVLKTNRTTCHIPIILLTAKAAEENIIQGLETGADDYITKPFNTKILCARIKNLIDLRRQMQMNLDRKMKLQPAEIPASTIDEKFIKALQAVIDKNISDPDLNVEGLGRKLNMSRPTVYRKILALSGKTPHEFIKSYRLKRAAQLLESGFGSVTEVAFEVGFASRTYFTKCFKERFHQLPSTYQDGRSH